MNPIQQAAEHCRVVGSSAVAAYHRLEGAKMGEDYHNFLSEALDITLAFNHRFISLGGPKVLIAFGGVDEVKNDPFEAVYCSDAVPDSDRRTLEGWASPRCED